MRYFKTKDEFIFFVHKELLDKKKRYLEYYKDESSSCVESRYTYYIKNSHRVYDSMDGIIDELKQNNLLFEIQRMFEKGICSFDFAGYVLLHTQLVKLLAGDENLNNDILRFKLLTVNQTCDFLQLSRPSVYKLLKDGVIPHVEIIGQKRVQMNDLLHFILKSKNQKE
nr:helix-turn-helix domain-containing protein [uncultured Draconibacterium sp.]